MQNCINIELLLSAMSHFSLQRIGCPHLNFTVGLLFSNSWTPILFCFSNCDIQPSKICVCLKYRPAGQMIVQLKRYTKIQRSMNCISSFRCYSRVIYRVLDNSIQDDEGKWKAPTFLCHEPTSQSDLGLRQNSFRYMYSIDVSLTFVIFVRYQGRFNSTHQLWTNSPKKKKLSDSISIYCLIGARHKTSMEFEAIRIHVMCVRLIPCKQT